jgi:hypothetical protein
VFWASHVNVGVAVRPCAALLSSRVKVTRIVLVVGALEVVNETTPLDQLECAAASDANVPENSVALVLKPVQLPNAPPLPTSIVVSR